MQSALKNIYNLQPEQLGVNETLCNYTDTGIIAGALAIPLDFGRVYIIERIKTCVSMFVNLGSTIRAYPNFEQFQLNLLYKAEITDANNSRQSVLFDNMLDTYTDGSVHTHTFTEPWIIENNRSKGTQLLFTVSSQDGISRSLQDLSTGIPTSPIVYFVQGSIVCDGFSMSTNEYSQYKEKLKL